MNISAPQREQRTLRPELLPGLAFLIFAGAVAALGLYRASLPPYLAKLCFEIAAPLCLTAGAFLSAYVLEKARTTMPRERQVPARRGARTLPPLLRKVREYLDRIRNRLAKIEWRADWMPLGVVLVSTGLTLYFEYRGWKIAANQPSSRADQWAFGCLIGLCFPVLVGNAGSLACLKVRCPKACL